MTNEIDMRVGMDVAQAKAELESLKRSVSGFVNEVRTTANGLRINVNAQFDDAAARAAIESFRNGLRGETVRITVDVAGVVGAQGALDGVRNAVLGLGAATATTLPVLRDYNDELNRMQLAARAAADEVRRAAAEQERLRRAGGGNGGGGNGGGSGGDNDGSVWRKHALAVAGVAQEYSHLSARLLVVKSAMAVLTAAVSGAIPVLGQMAATGGMVLATFASTAHIAGVTKEMQKLSETTGMTTQSLRELQLLSGFSGISRNIAEFGDAAKGLEAVNERIMQIGWDGKKNEDFANHLDRIGINVDTLVGKRPDEVLLLIDAALQKTGDTAREQENFFEKIAGKGTADLIPLLRQQNAELDIARKYMRDVGAIQSDAEVKAMEQTNKELSLFKIGLEGVATRLSVVGSNITNTLAPNIRQLFIDAKKPIAEWSNDVDKALKKFKTDLDNTGSWTIAIKLSLKEAYPTLYGFVASAADFGRGYGQAFITPMINELKRGYASIRGALGEAGGAENLGKGLGDAMLPVTGIVRNVVDAVKLLIVNWDQLKVIASYTPVGFVVSHWDKVTAAFAAVGNGIKTVAGYFGLLNPATLGSVSGMQMFTATLLGLLAAGASTRLALGALGAAFSVIRFAIAPAILAVQVAPAAFAALATAAGVAGRAFQVLALAVRLNPIGAVVTTIAAGAGLIIANWDKLAPYFSNMWAQVKASFSSAFGGISSLPYSQIPAKIITGFASFGADLYKIGVNAVADLAKGLLTSLGVSEANARRVSDGINNTFITLPTKLLDMGANAIRQLSAGIVSMINDPVGTATRVGQAVTNAFINLPKMLWEAGVEAITRLGAGILSALGVPESRSSEVMSAVKNSFANLPSEMLNAGVAAMGKLAEGISNAGAQALEAAKRIASEIISTIKNAIADTVQAGKDLAAGLAEGVKNKANEAAKAASEMADSVVSGVKGVFQTQSPSKVTREIGGWVAEGLAIGITAKGLQAVDSARALSAKIASAIKIPQPDFKLSLPTFTKVAPASVIASPNLTKEVLATNSAYQQLTLSVDSYGLAQDKISASSGAWGEQLTQAQKLSKDLGQTLQQEVLGGLQKLVNTGNDLLDKLINKMLESVLMSDEMTKGFSSIFGGSGGAGGGFGGFLGSLFGFAQGAAFTPQAVQAYASGGYFHNTILKQTTPFMTAQGLAVAGEAGAEAVMPLMNGNQVRAQMPDGSVQGLELTRINGMLGVVIRETARTVGRYATGGTFNTSSNSTTNNYSNASSSAPSVNVNIVNQHKDVEVSQSSSTDSSGNISIDLIVNRVEQSITDKSMRGAGLARIFKTKG